MQSPASIKVSPYRDLNSIVRSRVRHYRVGQRPRSPDKVRLAAKPVRDLIKETRQALNSPSIHSTRPHRKQKRGRRKPNRDRVRSLPPQERETPQTSLQKKSDPQAANEEGTSNEPGPEPDETAAVTNDEVGVDHHNVLEAPDNAEQNEPVPRAAGNGESVNDGNVATSNSEQAPATESTAHDGDRGSANEAAVTTQQQAHEMEVDAAAMATSDAVEDGNDTDSESPLSAQQEVEQLHAEERRHIAAYANAIATLEKSSTLVQSIRRNELFAITVRPACHVLRCCCWPFS